MLERLYAIKRPFDFQVSLQRHRSIAIWTKSSIDVKLRFCYYQMVPGDSILLDLSHHSGNSIDVWFDNWKQLEEPNWLQMRAPSLWTSRLCEFSNIYFHRGNALWPFLCRKLPIGKFKLQVLFSLGSFVSDKNIWSALSLSFTYLGASWLQAHKRANL